MENNKDWKDIHEDFGKKNYIDSNETYQQKWEEKSLTYQDAKEWIPIGFKPINYEEVKEWKDLKFASQESRLWINVGVELNNCKFIAWLRDAKKETPEWVINYQEDYKILSERFKKYGLCSECNQLNTGEQWCQSCNASHLQEGFSNWTSGNPKIDMFIQKYQLEATDADKVLEWVPYDEFTEIEYLAEGGFGKVYKAKWMAGNVHHWDAKSKQWQREQKEVALKSLNNSSSSTDFLQEAEKHKIIDDWFNNIVPCYGLSQDPNGDYLMVMQYMPEGNLRHYLSNNRELTLKDKLSQLHTITQGLKDIHAKNLVHRDFHSGNILKGIEKTSCLITDLGLCKPANETNQEEKVFGVMPYVAPEVLQNQPYTQKADIYSFGIIIYEVLTGLPPYYDQDHNLDLALRICQGLRPKFNIKIPHLLESLVRRCWDKDPQKRPAANELERTLREWQEEIDSNEDTEFQKQLQETEEFNKNLLDEIKYPDLTKEIHSGAVYHSKLLPTKEITKILNISKDLSLDINDFNLDELNVEETQEETFAEIKQDQQPLQIQPPYGTPGSS